MSYVTTAPGMNFVPEIARLVIEYLPIPLPLHFDVCVVTSDPNIEWNVSVEWNSTVNDLRHAVAKACDDALGTSGVGERHTQIQIVSYD